MPTPPSVSKGHYALGLGANSAQGPLRRSLWVAACSGEPAPHVYVIIDISGANVNYSEHEAQHTPG